MLGVIGAVVAATLVWRPRRIVVTGDSMRPTLEPGDRLLTVTARRVRAGDVVAVPDPRDQSRLLVKRVASISPDGVHVVGDDAPASTDSRVFGAVPLASVRGRAVYRYAPPGRTARLARSVLYPGDGRADTLVAMPSTRIERLLSADYLGDLPARPIEEIRAMRAECQEVEVALSYVRRLVQGRIDIVAAEQRRRAEGLDPVDLATLVENLPGILAEHTHAPGVGRLPTLMAPSPEDAQVLTAELDAVIDADRLGSLSDLSDDDTTRLSESLIELERSVSARRRALHERIDALQAELTRRYRTGEATVESLLR